MIRPGNVSIVLAHTAACGFDPSDIGQFPNSGQRPLAASDETAPIHRLEDVMYNSIKDDIIRKTVELFNARGVSSVSMRDIADATGISVGNLTYHFRRKKDLILAIMSFQDEYGSNYPAAENINLAGFNSFLNSNEAFKEKFSYYFDNFVDLSRMYKEVAVRQQAKFNGMIEYVKAALYSLSEKGSLEEERYPGQYVDLANGVVMATAFWGHRLALTKHQRQERVYMKAVIWSMITPCLTEEGMREFRETIAPKLVYIRNK
jgi:AcrR family transcriptional regulator